MMNIIEQLCCVSVKIQCEEKGVKPNGGSGTIISDGTNFYVMTAAHCINKSDTEFFSPECIKVISFADKKAKEIKVLSIEKKSEIKDSYDFALLVIEDPNIEFDFVNGIKRCDETFEGETYFFYGYGGLYKNSQGRKFNIVQNGKQNWHLVGDLINNQSIEAMKLMSGNSGAGVFFQKWGVLYCIGFVKKLLDTEGTFNDLVVFPSNFFDEILPSSTKESNFFELVKKWSILDEKALDEETRNDYKTNNVEYLCNLERKMNVLYPHEDEAKNKIDNQLDNYIKGLKLNQDLQKSPQIYAQLKEHEKNAFDEYMEDRTSYYADSSSALSDFKDVKTKIKDATAKILSYDSNKSLLNSYTNYSVAEKLLICSLDYKVD